MLYLAHVGENNQIVNAFLLALTRYFWKKGGETK